VSLGHLGIEHAPNHESQNLTWLFVADLGSKGIHEVVARKFCLVAADHPLVSAVSVAIFGASQHAV
jgi:hypothetical protein